MKGVLIMIKKAGVVTILSAIVLVLFSIGTGCQPQEVEVEEQIILEGEGIFTGQIDSSSVEIIIDGQPRAFGLGTGVSITGISDGAEVFFAYVEEETRPVLLSIMAVHVEDEVLRGEGFYNGQIDSHSVEIDYKGQPTAFALGEGTTVEDIAEGSRVAFTYQEDAERMLLLTIEVIAEPSADEAGELVGEGTFVGQIDAQSVEIEIFRAFVLGENVSVEEIEDGSEVAFTFTETGPRAVLDSIKAIDEPVEGDVMQGILVGQIDGQSVEIHYFQAFALDDGADISDIEDGAEVFITYRTGTYRPILTSVTVK